MATAFQHAEQRLSEFRLVDHHEALACEACAEKLLLGIEVFRWLEQSQRELMRGFATDPSGFPQQYAALVTLYTRCLEPCGEVLEAAARHAKNYSVDNLVEFRELVAKARAFVAAAGFESLQDAAEMSQDNANFLQSLTG